MIGVQDQVDIAILNLLYLVICASIGALRLQSVFNSLQLAGSYQPVRAHVALTIYRYNSVVAENLSLPYLEVS